MSPFGLSIPSPPVSCAPGVLCNSRTRPSASIVVPAATARTARVRSFVETTFRVVSSPGSGCWWTDDGDAFVISEDDFATTCNIKSFIRQCNHYGFTKQRLPSSVGRGVLSQFSHPNFKRGRPDLLREVDAKHAATGTPSQARAKSATKEGGLVASLRARVSELEDQLEETAGKLQSLQQLFRRTAGTKRPLGQGVKEHAGDGARAKRLRAMSSYEDDDCVDAPTLAPTLSAAAVSFFDLASSSCSSGIFSEVDKLDGQASQRDEPTNTGQPGKKNEGSEVEGFVPPEGPIPEHSRDSSDSCDVSDLDSQDPLSLDLDALSGAMSECSLSLDGGPDDARSLTLSLDLETADGNNSEGARLADFTSVHSVASDDSGITSAERARGLTRSNSFELMRKLLRALPAASNARGTTAGGCSSDGPEEAGPSDVETRAQ